MTRSLDLPALDRVDTLAQELALLQDTGKRRIAILGTRHVPVVSVHLVELEAEPAGVAPAVLERIPAATAAMVAMVVL